MGVTPQTAILTVQTFQVTRNPAGDRTSSVATQVFTVQDGGQIVIPGIGNSYNLTAYIDNRHVQLDNDSGYDLHLSTGYNDFTVDEPFNSVTITPEQGAYIHAKDNNEDYIFQITVNQVT